MQAGEEGAASLVQEFKSRWASPSWPEGKRPHNAYESVHSLPQIKEEYLGCLKQHSSDAEACRELAKTYLKCRMERCVVVLPLHTLHAGQPPRHHHCLHKTSFALCCAAPCALTQAFAASTFPSACTHLVLAAT
jgi:hypothetical protein